VPVSSETLLLLAQLGGARAIVFDLDGTLVDTADDLWRALNGALVEGELAAATLEEVLASVHLGLDGTARAVLHARGAEARFDLVAASYRRNYSMRAHAGSRLYPGVPEFLAACRRKGVAVAVCTNKATADAKQLLSALAIAHFFSDVIGIDAGAGAKPDPAPLLLALKRLACGPADAVFIGDSVIDAECADRAGVPFALFESGYGRREALAFGCTERFHSYRQLI